MVYSFSRLSKSFATSCDFLRFHIYSLNLGAGYVSTVVNTFLLVVIILLSFGKCLD